MKNADVATGASKTNQTDWRKSSAMAVALFVYVLCFSLAYLTLDAAFGALILFAVVQATMWIYARFLGEKFTVNKIAGLVLAFSGLVILIWPSLSGDLGTPNESEPAASNLLGFVLMSISAIAWGAYSIMGRSVSEPQVQTRVNFLLALLLCVPMLFIAFLFGMEFRWSQQSILAASASGVFASAIGYSIWYAVLPQLKTTTSAVIQLSVPVITAVLAFVFLSERFTWNFYLATGFILLGIALSLNLIVFKPRKSLN